VSCRVVALQHLCSIDVSSDPCVTCVLGPSSLTLPTSRARALSTTMANDDPEWELNEDEEGLGLTGDDLRVR
jgi:hypothetical protein